MRRYLWVVENGNGECLGEARIGDDSERRCHGHCQRLCHLLFFDLCKFSTIAITVVIALSISSPHYFESQSPFLTQFARYTFGLVYIFRPRSTLDLICPLKTGSCFSYFTLCYSHPPHYMKSLFSTHQIATLPKTVLHHTTLVEIFTVSHPPRSKQRRCVKIQTILHRVRVDRMHHTLL